MPPTTAMGMTSMRYDAKRIQNPAYCRPGTGPAGTYGTWLNGTCGAGAGM